MLKPLESFYCDTCGLIIDEPSHGYVEWAVTNDIQQLDYGWRIVHHKLHSPKEDLKDGCYSGLPRTASLKDFVGDDGQAWMLTFLDIGEHLPTSGLRSSVRDLREFV